MIITCPECTTRYQVDPATIGPQGRTVRCSKCGHSWTQSPPEDMPRDVAAEAPPELPPEPQEAAPRASSGGLAAGPRRLPRSGRSGRQQARGGLARAMWTLLIVVVGGTVAAAVVWRDAVMQTWPAAVPIYERIGLGADPPGTGLGLSNVSWKADSRDGGRVLLVQGEVANTSDVVRNVPPMQGVIYDKDDRELQRWIFAAPETRLLPGERVAFRTELKSPPAGASRLQIRFDAKTGAPH